MNSKLNKQRFSNLNFINFDKVDNTALKAAKIIEQNNFITLNISEEQENALNEENNAIFNYKKFLCRSVDEYLIDELTLKGNVCTFLLNTDRKFLDLSSTLCTLKKRCNYTSCPLIIAAYMKYAKEMNIELFHPSENTSSTSLKYDDILNELNELIGMEEIKAQVKQLISFLHFNKKVKKLAVGKKEPILNLHMALTGNPGTGKTTIARIISKILFKLKYTRENKFMEVTKEDLVGEHVGHTPIKTGEVLRKAKGGVLFIDEAYSICSDGTYDDGFGKECIASLIKFMEDNKNDIIIIFAGYKKEMDSFINKNPGLRSRIAYILNFQDYSNDELLEIFKRKMTSYGYTLDKVSIPYIISEIKKAKSSTNFGNGRFIDNFIQNIIFKHAVNVENEEDSEILLTITKNDIPKTVNNLNNSIIELNVGNM